MQGVYCIENKINGKKYYGSSKNIEKRFSTHITQLKNRKHHNIFLQRAVEKYGIDSFLFYVVEEMPENSTREDMFLLEETYVSTNTGGYNIGSIGGGDNLTSNPNKESIILKMTNSIIKLYSEMSQEERNSKYGRSGQYNGNWKNGGIYKKLCPSCGKNKIKSTSYVCSNCVDKSGINNPFYGKTHSEESKNRISYKLKENSWSKGRPPEEFTFTKKFELTHPDGKVEYMYGLKSLSYFFCTSVANVYATIGRMGIGVLPTRRSRFYKYFIKEISR